MCCLWYPKSTPAYAIWPLPPPLPPSPRPCVSFSLMSVLSLFFPPYRRLGVSSTLKSTWASNTGVGTDTGIDTEQPLGIDAGLNSIIDIDIDTKHRYRFQISISTPNINIDSKYRYIISTLIPTPNTDVHTDVNALPTNVNINMNTNSNPDTYANTNTNTINNTGAAPTTINNNDAEKVAEEARAIDHRRCSRNRAHRL